MPEYPGGMPAMMEFIGKNIKYPVAAQKAKIQGRVTIQFIVNTEGNIINPRVLRSADPLLDAEAIRLTTIMPKWKPGMQRGQAVNVNIQFLSCSACKNRRRALLFRMPLLLQLNKLILSLNKFK